MAFNRKFVVTCAGVRNGTIALSLPVYTLGASDAPQGSISPARELPHS
jgi:hypothetical protein